MRQRARVKERRRERGTTIEREREKRRERGTAREGEKERRRDSERRREGGTAEARQQDLTWMFVAQVADPRGRQEDPASTSGACAGFQLPEKSRISCYVIGILFSSQMRACLHRAHRTGEKECGETM